MIQYTYTIQKLNVIKVTQYEHVVNYAVTLLQGSDGVNVASLGFGQELTLDESLQFTPYEQLTESQVTQWVKDAAGPEKIAQLELKVAEMLADTESFISPALPWKEPT